MVTNPALYISMGGDFISPSDVNAVSLYSAVDRTLPEMNFIVNDSLGAYERALKFYIGAQVSSFLTSVPFSQQDIKESTEGISSPEELTKFIVCGTDNKHESNNEDLSGSMTVYCRQAWYFFGDYQGHAYAPQKLSKLIQSVCKNANKEAGLDIIDDNFIESSDPGNLPRYKAVESDLDFIEKKLLPFTNIEDSNVFFFVDIYNRPHLTSFEQMKTKKPKVILTPPPELKSTVFDSIKKYKEQNTGMEEYEWLDISTKIGDRDIKKQLGQIREKLLLENNMTGKVYKCKQNLSATMGSGSGKSISNAVPVNSAHMMLLDATISHVFPNRVLSDALAMARNNDLYLDDMFYVEVSIANFVTDLIPGDTVQLFVPLVKKKQAPKDVTPEESDAREHYINRHQGKWVVYSTRYDYDSVGRNMMTVLGLMRPTLIMNTDTTTVLNPDYFYKVED